MRFSAASAFALAFAASALADTTAGFDVISAPGEDTGSITAGETFTLKWAPGDYTTGTVTISLIGGADSAHLNTVETIATDVESDAGSYDWAVESTLGSLATYGIQITLNSNSSIYQYSFPFTITGGSSSSSSSSSASSSVASSSVASYSASSVSASSSAVSSYSTAASSTLATVTSAPASSGSSGSGTTATLTSFATATASTSKTASATTSVATGAAHHVTAGYMALFGGLAAVAFAQ